MQTLKNDLITEKKKKGGGVGMWGLFFGREHPPPQDYHVHALRCPNEALQPDLKIKRTPTTEA